MQKNGRSGMKLPENWQKALDSAWDAVIESAKVLQVDNRPIKAQEINDAGTLLHAIAAQCATQEKPDLKKARAEIERNDKVPASVQILTVLGLGELEKKLK